MRMAMIGINSLKRKIKMNTKEYQTYSSQNNQNICEPIADYCRVSRESMGSLFEDIVSDVTESDIRVGVINGNLQQKDKTHQLFILKGLAWKVIVIRILIQCQHHPYLSVICLLGVSLAKTILLQPH